MFHRPNREVLDLFAAASDLPLIRRETSGGKNREIKDLKSSLKNIPAEGVVSGALASTYQKKRIEKICKELELASVMPLWKKDPLTLLKNMLAEEFETIITSVSTGGLTKEWLGRKIDRNCIEDLEKLNEKYGIHLSGEGGEYETLVLNAPYFEKRIALTDTERVWKGDRGHLKINRSELATK